MRSLSSRPLALAAVVLVAAASFVVITPWAARAADARPAKKDSNPRIRPKEVTLTPSVEPAEARAGATVTYRVTAKLEPGWHIYTQAREPGENGPRHTTFDLFDPAGLKVAGDWSASKPPIRKQEPAFNNMTLDFFEDEVTWSLTLQVPPGTTPGPKTIRCQAGYQICDAKSCKIPGQWTLPDVVLTVVPGVAAATAVPSSPPEATAAKPKPASAPAEPSRPAAEVGEIAKRAELGLLPFLLFSALGGLGALVMPCVWPMVPITVNFFVKQGQHNPGRATGLAITYCLAIIGVFTAVGVLCSFFFSATALQNLANNGWLNAFIAALFLAFGLSLLGLFEIRLPNVLLNASSRGESRGGLVGVIFMAMTLTITSFTCTFPVVGGLVVMASKGQFFYPIIGLATFSAVLALPFFLLALSPGLLSRMPRSGDWMNAVKVVGGLIEVGAAFKFVNTAEIGFGAIPKDAWFDAQVVLTIWVVLALVCGVYLLGLFRTDHDHDEVKVGPGRLLAGALLLMLALFLAPALFGRPPQSKVWYALVGILPPDVGELNPIAVASGPSGGAGSSEVEAVSKDPEQAEREQTSFHGVAWGFSLEAAREKAKADGRPILIDFTGVNCANCRAMEQGVMPLPEVVALLKKFVTVQLYTDLMPIGSITPEQRHALVEKNQGRLTELTPEPSNPFYAALGPDGQVLATIGGAMSPSTFIDFLNRALDKHQDRAKVAQAAPSR